VHIFAKQFPEETWMKIYLGQDSDVFDSRIRSKIVRIRNTDSCISYVRVCLQVLEVAPLSDYQTTSPAVVAVVSGNRFLSKELNAVCKF
jgi:hypothetical protein